MNKMCESDNQRFIPTSSIPTSSIPTLSIPTLSIPIWSMLTKWKLAKWELTTLSVLHTTYLAFMCTVVIHILMCIYLSNMDSITFFTLKCTLSIPTSSTSHFVNSHFVNIDQMGIDKVGIDKVGIDEVGRYPTDLQSTVSNLFRS